MYYLKVFEKDFSNDISPESRAKNRLADNHSSVSGVHKKVSEAIKERLLLKVPLSVGQCKNRLKKNREFHKLEGSNNLDSTVHAHV